MSPSANSDNQKKKKRKKRKKRLRLGPPGRRSAMVRRVLVVLAVLCVAYSIYDCQGRGRMSTAGRSEHIANALRQLGRADPAMVAAAARKLGELKAKKAVEPLTGLLGAEDAAVRRAAIQALAQIGDLSALPKLEERKRALDGGEGGSLTQDERAAEQQALGEAIQALQAGK